MDTNNNDDVMGLPAVRVEGAVAEAAPAEEEAVAGAAAAEVSPWEFMAEERVEDDAAPASDAGAEAEEYVLEFGEHYTGCEETTARITAIAKEAGLDAKGFSQALQGITEYLVEQQAAKRSADLEVLKDAWKGDFDKNMKQVRGVLREVFAGQELSAERMAALTSADVFKLVHRLSDRLGEGKSAVGSAAPVLSPQQMADDMLNNPENPLHSALLNPMDKGHEEAAARYNKLMGMTIF